MRDEIWKPVIGYEGLYEVSNMGNVRSLNYNHTGKPKQIRSFVTKSGYVQVILYKKPLSTHFLVHRLVAQAFLEPGEGKENIDHINTDRTDNRVENLRWCTHKENSNNPLTYNRLLAATSDESRNQIIGECTKENWEKKEYREKHQKVVHQFDKEGNLIKEWSSIKEAQDALKLSHISACCKGKTKYKSCGGFIWKYAS